MVGNDADTNNSPSQNNNTGSHSEYLKLAAQACAAGDVVLGLHLYLAAYEKSLQDSYMPDPEVIEGLRQAWTFACSHKERSLAEYIFEKLEPYLRSEEVAQHAAQLQRLALDKLEEFGLTREDLEDMTDMISQDFFGMDPSAFFMRVESGMPASDMFGSFYKGLTRGRSSESAALENEPLESDGRKPKDPAPGQKPEDQSPVGAGNVAEEGGHEHGALRKEPMQEGPLQEGSSREEPSAAPGRTHSEPTSAPDGTVDIGVEAEGQPGVEGRCGDRATDSPAGEQGKRNESEQSEKSEESEESVRSEQSERSERIEQSVQGGESTPKAKAEAALPSADQAKGKDASHYPDLPKFDLTPFGTLASFDGGTTQLMFPSIIPHGDDHEEQPADRMTYRDLVGYESAIATMRDFGIGMHGDPNFKELVDTLNKQHGLNKIPITDSFLFRSPVREDANQFMVATMGELALPAIRMRMEENLQGMPVLCVMASSDNQPRLNASRNAFEGGGVLILEDIDLWGSPLAEAGNEDLSGFIHAQLSRGAREAINLIRSAVENPDVYVLVSSSQESAIDNFFFELLEPLTVIDIEFPTSVERADLWVNIAKEHPSLRKIDRAGLVEYSAGMSRFDIYMAAREAVEDAYKASLMAKKYVPVSPENVFEKIAAYQPLDSDEYQQLENAVVESFKSELEQLDDLLKGISE